MSHSAEFAKTKYQEAIDKLEEYQSNEPDEVKREEAGRKITAYHDKIINAAWDEITGRTAELNSLTTDLSAIIDNAGDNPSVSGAIAGLNGIVAEISNAMNPEEGGSS